MEQVYFVAQVGFWVSLSLLVLCYALFPITLPFVSEIFKRRRKPQPSTKFLPTVSILVSAYNEEAVIERKIHNILSIDYPKDKLQVLIGDDGSADRTAEIIAGYAGTRALRW